MSIMDDEQQKYDPESGNETEPESREPEADSELTSLEDLQTTDEVIQTGEVARVVTVRRPYKERFFRVNPDPGTRLANVGILDWQEDKQRVPYLVLPVFFPKVAGLAYRATVVSCVDDEHEWFTWALKQNRPGFSTNACNDSAMEVAETAETQWVRLLAKDGRYGCRKPEEDFWEPVFCPDPLLAQLNQGFRGRIINSLDHPILRRLEGRQL
jgi:hypothetical protein